MSGIVAPDRKFSRGEVVGSDGRLRSDRDGRLREFDIRLSRAAAIDLSKLTRDNASADRGGVIWTVTDENLNRIRVLRDRTPQYERNAASIYLRGDVARVTGTNKSCNVAISELGTGLVAERLRMTAERSREWIELRARIVHRRQDSQRSLLEFIPDTELHAAAEERRLGETGATLASDVWTAEDFRDWEPSDG